MPKETKIERWIPRDELPALLHRLADSLAAPAGTTETELAVDARMLRRFDLGLKPSGEGFSLKLKVKQDLPDETPAVEVVAGADDTGGRPAPLEKYERLKKRMDGSFAALIAAARRRTLPAESLLDGFLADSERMLAYPGKGDAQYGDYRQACEALLEAFQAQDPERFAMRLQTLDALKQRCHDRYA